uniref:RING-type domain-containing protein n=1 Tax=Aegilops tauschii subsp. strangulata TaxID=200361 RepID=A0A453QLU5_AEGTS
AVAEALKIVEALADELNCPICLQDDDDDTTAAGGTWKETPCGHRFHGRCVERWLHAEGSCPMCRRQVVTKPTTPDTSSVASLRSALADIFEAYGQDVVTELQQQLPL